MIESDSYRWENFRNRIWTWQYNLRNKIWLFVARRLFRPDPRCVCGWPLAQRFDGTWLCGHCLNGDDACPCYLCGQIK